MTSTAHPWQSVELTLRSAATAWANAYADCDVWAVFRHDDGTELRRPAFWDGGDIWRVRFAPTKPGRWRWTSASAPHDAGLAGRTGEIVAVEDEQLPKVDRFRRHGFWTIPSGGRNLRHADGTSALMVADTPWALPWRATLEQCEIYAADRAAKGFNAALLMSVQPDRGAVGPRDRTAPDGFDVGFEDLPDGHLLRLNPAYFQYLDGIAAILLRHGIAPVWQPVFHGFGWKGLGVAGLVVPAEEYARYCRYLVARYGAQPAMWLVAADGDGRAPGVDPGGWEIERWDAYGHPTGLHYAPHQEPFAYHDRPWLDFQWCQTGHTGEHLPNRVATMWERAPAKAVANGEPTYENIGRPGRAAGWWQGHEAWMNLCAGGTMGVVYGAGSLWQWRLTTTEEHPAWCMAEAASWREALDFAGSAHVGAMARILAGLELDGMAPDFLHCVARPALLVPRRLLIVYLHDGGLMRVARRPEDVPHFWRLFDAKTGDLLATGEGLEPFQTGDGPRVVVYTARPAA